MISTVDVRSHHALSTLATTEMSRLVAVRYLAGIVELRTFWEYRMDNDLHSLSDVLFSVSIRLLEDLAADCDTHHAAYHSDLLALDLEGINAMILAALTRMPLNRLLADDTRTANSLKFAAKLMRQLQRFATLKCYRDSRILIDCVTQR